LVFVFLWALGEESRADKGPERGFAASREELVEMDDFQVSSSSSRLVEIDRRFFFEGRRFPRIDALDLVA